MSRRAPVAALETTATFSGNEPRDEFGDVIDADEPTIAPDPQATSYVVIRPCVVVKGARGSAGVFYADSTVLPWDCANGRDSATPEELNRLVELGFIRAV
jgi:hypothetical protein